MKLVRNAAVVLVAGTLVFGCKKDDKKEPAKDPKAPTATKTTEQKKPPMEKKKPWTAEDTAKTLTAVGAALNAHDHDKLMGFYADNATLEMVESTQPMKMSGKDAIAGALKMWWTGFPDVKSEPQLTLVNGNNFAMISHDTSTNTGPMMGKPPTGKKQSMYNAMFGSFNADGKIASQRMMYDEATTLGQLGVMPAPMAPTSEKPWEKKIVAIAAGDDKEKKNVELIKGLGDMSAPDAAKKYAAAVHDEITFRYVGEKEARVGKKAFEEGMKEWTSMVKVKSGNATNVWGAGDWVVAETVSTKEMLKDMPGAKGTKGKEVKTTVFEFFEIADGKIKTHYIFENSLQYAVQLGMLDMSKMMGGDAAKGGEPKKEMKKDAKK